MHYMGSLEIMNALKAGGQNYDAVWPASSMWISMGDAKHIVKRRGQHLHHADRVRHCQIQGRQTRLG